MADVKWIKITTDIFDDEKMLLIESLPEADSIIVIWFKLLCLAGKMNNSGVFMMNDRIAYTDKMLATIFRRKEATVQMALKTFEQFGMIEIIDGVITIPNWGKHQNLDQIESKKEYMKNYMREYRAKQKQLTCKSNSKTNSKANVSEADKERDKEREIEIERYNNNVQNAPFGIPNDSQEVHRLDTQDRLGKDSIGEDSIYINTMCNSDESHDAKSPSKSDINDLFERVWKLYPNKKGKGQVSDAKKKKLYEVGYDELERAIDRYKEELKQDADWRKPQNGSTFFNSGFIDYLDKNYEPREKVAVNGNKTAQQLDEFYDMAAKWAEGSEEG